jgi:DNA-binding beta-propeller fold protein YncE
MRLSRKWAISIIGLIWLVCSTDSQAMIQNDLLVTSSFSDTIERFDGFTGESLGSFVAAGAGGLDGPAGVAVGPDGNVYVTSSTQEVLRYDGETGAFIDVFATGLNSPNNVQFNGDFMYVGQFASGSNGLIKRFNAVTGAFVDDFITSEFVDGFEFSSDAMFVSDFRGGVSKFDLTTGDFIEELIARGDGGLNAPTALLLLDNDDLLVSSYNDNSVKRYDSNGTYLGDVITDLTNPEGLGFGPNGNLFAGSYTEGIIYEYDRDDFSFIGEFANNGPVTNFFTFRITAVPEPAAGIPILAGLLISSLKRRRLS